MTEKAKTQPDFYEPTLTAEASGVRARYENDLEAAYAELPNLTGVTRLKALKAINGLEQRLSWQGANPKILPFKEMRDHIRGFTTEDPIEDKYQARIGNRATAIRAYCVQCQGGSVSCVKECASLTCPLHPFRMGKDPLRGYELPKAAIVIIEDEAEGDDQFEEGDDADDKDATE